MFIGTRCTKMTWWPLQPWRLRAMLMFRQTPRTPVDNNPFSRPIVSCVSFTSRRLLLYYAPEYRLHGAFAAFATSDHFSSILHTKHKHQLLGHMRSWVFKILVVVIVTIRVLLYGIYSTEQSLQRCAIVMQSTTERGDHNETADIYGWRN